MPRSGDCGSDWPPLACPELLADYRPITAQVTSAGIKDTATGAITLLTG